MNLVVEKLEKVKQTRIGLNDCKSANWGRKSVKRGFRGTPSLLLAILIGVLLIGQDLIAQVPVQSWRSHLPMSRFDWVGQLDGRLFAANRFGVISYDEEEGSVESLTKTNVLTETDLSCFSCSLDEGICVIGYENGNLDFLDADMHLTNQPAILNANIVGDKAVREVFFKEGIAYLLTGIGVLEIDLASFNVQEYGALRFNDENVEIMSGIIQDDTLMVSSPQGVFRTLISTLFEDQSLTQVSFNAEPELVRSFFTINGRIHAIYSQGNSLDTLLIENNGSLIQRSELAGSFLRQFTQRGDKLIGVLYDEVVEYDANFSRIRNIYTYSAESGGIEPSSILFDAASDDILIADRRYGLVRSSFDDQFNSQVINISSPRTGVISVLDSDDELIYALPGGNDFTFNQPYVYRFEEEEWTSSLYYLDTNNSIRNTSSIVRSGDKTYIGYDGSGLMILDGEGAVVAHYDEVNSQIEDDKDGYYGIRGLELDDDGNLWMLNSRATSTLSILDPDENWYTISLEGFPKPIADNFIRHSSGIFVFSLKEDGLICYDPGDDPLDLSDDEFVHLTSSPSSGNLPNNTINCLVEDRDGELWIGSDEGIAVLYSLPSVFNAGGENAQRIIVNQDGYNGYLFESDAVIAIEVDGANRKWVAPRGAGLFLISADGQEQIVRYTEDDSPLLNDNISDLTMHPETGELFIATESGLQSLQTDATEPETAISSIRVFPNPVKPGYNGLISFSGLTDEAYVRVTDVSGNLVFETESKGGTAVWDGKDRGGSKVTSGIYLIHAGQRNGAGGSLSRLMILN